MTFTLGNVVVFLAACLVAVILRQYDRNNRSLKQVRKYVDSVRGDLKRLVQERGDQVRDLTISFDVNYKRGRALADQLNSLYSGATEKITAYRQQYEHLEKKIDRALDSVSNLDAYYETSTKKFAHFQKHVQRIEQQFETTAKHAESLEDLRATFPALVSEQRERFQQIMDDKYAIFAAQLQKLQEQSQQQASVVQQVIDDGLAQLKDAGSQSSKKLMAFAHKSVLRERKERQALSSHVNDLRSQQEAIIAEIRAEYTKQFDTLIDQERSAMLARQEQVLQDEETRTRAQLNEAVATLKERTESEIDRVVRVGQELAQNISTIEDRSEYLGAELDTTLSDFKEQATQKLGAVNHEVEQALGAIRNHSEHIDGVSSETLAALKARADQGLQEINTQLEQELSAMVGKSSRLDDGLQQLQIETNERITFITQEVGVASERAQQMEKSFQEQKARMDNEISEHVRSLSSKVEQRISDQFSASLAQMQEIITEASNIERYYQTLNKKHEQYINDQEQDFEQKIQRIAQDGAQKIDNVQKTLYSYTEKIQQEQQAMTEQFAELGSEFQQQREQAISSMQHEYQSRLQEQVDGLQNYLQIQSGKIDTLVNERIEQSQAYIDERMVSHQEELTRAFSKKSELLEQAWENMSAINARTLRELQEKEQDIGEYRANVQKSLSDLELRVEQQQTSISEKVSDIHTQSQMIIEEELGRLQTMFSEKSEAKNIEFVQMLEGMETDLHKRLEHEKQHLLTAHAEEIRRLIDSNVAQLQDVSEKEYERILRNQTSIQNEIAHSQQEIEQLKGNLSGYSDELRAQFTTQYNELTAVTEASFREMRDTFNDSRAEFGEKHESIVTNVDQETRRLYDALLKVQSTQRDVEDQHKSLQQTVTLQKSLSASVEALRDDVSQLEAQRQEIKLIEREFVRAQDAAHKVQQTLTRLNGDRRKIEMLEKNWKDLHSLSDTVKRNLNKMNIKYDRVQEVQVQLRELDELGKAVSGQYERLQNQQNIVNSTVEGIEKNFDSLSSIEERVQRIERDIKVLPHEVSDMRERVEMIRSNTSTADDLEKQGKQLGKMLTKVEKRITELTKSQNWLANLETRLQNIYSEADEKVSIMQSLVQNRSTGDIANIPIDSKKPDTIKQLARAGWSPEEISSSLKVSIGEIEVVLGMAAASR